VVVVAAVVVDVDAVVDQPFNHHPLMVSLSQWDIIEYHH
jgi:hypothetical protein